MTGREAYEAWYLKRYGQPPMQGWTMSWETWQAALEYERAKQAEPVARQWDGDPACTCGTSATCYKHSGDSQSSTAPPAFIDGHGALFGYKFTEGGSNGLVTIYEEDDELWHPKMTFDIAWLPDLMQVAARAARQSAPPAVQAEPVAIVDLSEPEPRLVQLAYSLTHGQELYAAPPADDEAVRLLREARKWVAAYQYHNALPSEMESANKLLVEIDAYLARVTK